MSPKYLLLLVLFAIGLIFQYLTIVEIGELRREVSHQASRLCTSTHPCRAELTEYSFNSIGTAVAKALGKF